MDADTERRLRDLRLNLAEVCLEGRIDRVAALCRNPSGDAIVTMINSGVRHLPLTKGDQAVAERCHRLLSVEHDIARKVCAYLSLTLFSFPQSIERTFALIDVPTPVVATVVKTMLSLPLFFTRDGARRRALAHLEAAVQEIHKAVRVIDEIDFREAVLDGFMDGFSMTPVYGEDVPLRDLAIQRADLIRAFLDTRQLARDVEPRPRGAGETVVSVGVLCPGAGSETAAMRGHLTGLDRSVFHVTALVPDEAANTVSSAFADLVDDVATVPVGDIARAAEAVGAHDFDILLAGANLTNNCRFPWTLLMAQRLARLQVAMHSCPLTTGMETVDVFINGSLNEPEDASEQYVESLALLPGSSNHYVFPGNEVAPDDITRAMLGIPDAVQLVASGTNYFKIGPDLVDAWARILAAEERSHLVLYPFNPNWTTHYPFKEGFLRFIQSSFAARGIAVERLHVLEPQASRKPILGVLKLADLYLDSFPYSGAVSLIDPISVGCPPIVREGNAARCRQSAALLREMGLEVLVTRSTEDYVTLTGRLLRDPALRREIADAVVESGEALRDGADEGLGAALGDLLIDVLKRKLGTPVI
jgi:hypothetical protein